MAEILAVELDRCGYLHVERPGKSEALWPGESTRMGRGTLEFHKGVEGAYFILRLTGSGREAFPPKTLEQGVGYNVGPKYAHKIVRPEDEKDPIRRVLRGLGVPIGALRFIKESQELQVNLHASDWNLDGSSEVVFTDRETIFCEAGERVHEKLYTSLSDVKVAVKAWRNWRQGYDPGPFETIWVDEGHAGIEQIWITPDVDPDLLREVLAPALEWVKAHEWYDPEDEEGYEQGAAGDEVEQCADYEPEEIATTQWSSDDLDCDTCHHPGPACTSCPVRTTV